MAPAPILMAHGAFCGGWVFEHFRQPFEAAGHAVTALDLPGHGPGAKGSDVVGKSMSDYARAIAEAAKALERPPVLVGHSLGGLAALMAATKVPTAGVILLAPSAPWGVSGVTMEEAVSAVSLYALGPFWGLSIDPDYPTLRRYGVDRQARADRHATFRRMTPESGRALWETLNWWLDPFMTTMIDASRIRAPVLALAGGKDAIHPAATVRETARRANASFEVFDEMSHWLPAEPGWEAVAGRCLAWLAEANARDAA